MPVVPFPVVGAGIVTSANDTFANRIAELGAYYVVRHSSGQYSIARYVRATDGFSQGEAAISDYATVKDYHVARSATTEAYQPLYRGVAAATISSGNCGYVFVAGYAPECAVSHTTASGDGLALSVSTQGSFSPNKASSVLNGTVGTTTDATVPFHIFAYAKGITATGHTGSVLINGFWG